MEKMQLLRLLILIVFCVGAYGSMGFVKAANATEEVTSQVADHEVAAHAADTKIAEDLREWSEQVSKNASDMAMSNFREMINLPGFDSDLKEEILKPRPSLQIFISSSMPKQLIKEYSNQARKYGGVLVLRGLPGGSMRKLSDFVMDIGEEGAGMQIDDEAFAAYGISTVPAIVLSEPATIFAGKSSASRFDKVMGNIKISAALELFAASGDMRSEARELLK